MNVAQIMSTKLVVCRAADTLDRAVQLMREHDIGCVVVLDAAGALAGIVTDRDICMTALDRDEPLRAIAVSVAMTSAVVTSRPHQDLHAVEREMSLLQLRRLPVLDDGGRPVGLISLSDIARASQSHTWVRPSDVASTLAAVSAPRPPAREGGG